MLGSIFRGLLLLIVALPAAALVAAQFGWLNGKEPGDLGVNDGKLKRPSRTDNSVSSQARLWPGDVAQASHIEPLSVPPGQGRAAMDRLAAGVSALPGTKVVKRTDDYLYAQCTTKWMKYVDDLEFWLEPSGTLIHVRSASRVGRKDFGVNRARVEALRAALVNRQVQP
jgi:uncharacterized protein (DUF1499 family)